MPSFTDDALFVVSVILRSGSGGTSRKRKRIKMTNGPERLKWQIICGLQSSKNPRINKASSEVL